MIDSFLYKGILRQCLYNKIQEKQTVIQYNIQNLMSYTKNGVKRYRYNAVADIVPTYG